MDDTPVGTPRRGRRQGEIPWDRIRATFEEGETNVSALSRRFKVKRESIIRHRDRENWTNHGSKKLADRVKSNVVSMKTRQVLDAVNERIGTEQVADDIVLALGGIGAELAASIRLAGKFRQFMERALDLAIGLGEVAGDDPKANNLVLGYGRGTFDAVASAAASLRSYTSLIREMAGLQAGQSNDDGMAPEDDDSRRLEVVHQTIEPKVVAVNEKGRLIS